MKHTFYIIFVHWHSSTHQSTNNDLVEEKEIWPKQSLYGTVEWCKRNWRLRRQLNFFCPPEKSLCKKRTSSAWIMSGNSGFRRLIWVGDGLVVSLRFFTERLLLHNNRINVSKLLNITKKQKQLKRANETKSCHLRTEKKF